MNLMEGPKDASLAGVLKGLAELFQQLMEIRLVGGGGQSFLPENKTKHKAIGFFLSIFESKESFGIDLG